jgi:hypothetical protein
MGVEGVLVFNVASLLPVVATVTVREVVPVVGAAAKTMSDCDGSL